MPLCSDGHKPRNPNAAGGGMATGVGRIHRTLFTGKRHFLPPFSALCCVVLSVLAFLPLPLLPLRPPTCGLLRGDISSSPGCCSVGGGPVGRRDADCVDGCLAGGAARRVGVAGEAGPLGQGTGGNGGPKKAEQFVRTDCPTPRSARRHPRSLLCPSAAPLLSASRESPAGDWRRLVVCKAPWSRDSPLQRMWRIGQTEAERRKQQKSKRPKRPAPLR
jgi:hypothetical protein